MKYLAASVGLLAAVANAQSSFRSPPPGSLTENPRNNPVYTEGEEVEVVWSTDEDSVALVIRQVWPSLPISEWDTVIFNGTNSGTTYTWTPDLSDFTTAGLEDGEMASFYFILYPVDDDSSLAASHDFNITASSVSSPTSSTFTSTSTSTSTSAPASTSDSGSVTRLTDPTQTSGGDGSSGDSDANGDSGEQQGGGDNDGDSGLSTGAIIGIAIGAALGAILILAGLGFFFWRRYRNKKNAAAAAAAAATPTQGYAQQPGYPPQPMYPQQMPPPHQQYPPHGMQQVVPPPQMYGTPPVEQGDYAVKQTPSPAPTPRYSVAVHDPASAELPARREY